MGGTAGKPILNAIESQGLDNVVTLVIRYYGGVKLGTGGLTRAYGKSGRVAAENAKIEKVDLKTKFELSIPFDFMGDIMYIINFFQGTDIVSQEYDEKGLVITIDIPVGIVKKFNDLLIDKSSGKYSL